MTVPEEIVLCRFCGMKNALQGYECCEDCLRPMLDSSIAVLEHTLKLSEDLIKSMERDLGLSGELGWTEEQKKQIEHTIKLLEQEVEDKRQLLSKVEH